MLRLLRMGSTQALTKCVLSTKLGKKSAPSESNGEDLLRLTDVVQRYLDPRSAESPGESSRAVRRRRAWPFSEGMGRLRAAHQDPVDEARLAQSTQDESSH